MANKRANELGTYKNTNKIQKVGRGKEKERVVFKGEVRLRMFNNSAKRMNQNRQKRVEDKLK